MNSKSTLHPPSSRSIFYLLSSIIIVLFFIVTFSFLTRHSPPIRQSADTYIGFNEGYGTTVSESVASLVSGTITNAVWKQEDMCLSGKCLFFDGTGDYVSFGDDADYDFTAAANWTISLWIRHAPKTSGTDTIIAKANASAGYKLYMESDGDITFAIDDDTTWDPDASVSSTAATYDDNRWHHIAAVKTGTTSIELYIDGVRVGQNLSVSGVADLTNSANFYVGIDGDGSSNPFTGFIDELKVYTTTAKTAETIKSDALPGSTTSGTSASFGPNRSYLSDGLVGYWQMDDNVSGNGATITDISGNGNNGTTDDGANDTGMDCTTGGKFGTGCTFDGTDDYINLLDPASLTLTNTLTVSAWIKLNAAAGRHIIYARGESIYFEFNGNNNNLFLNIRKANADLILLSYNLPSPNAWHHVIATYDNFTAIIYVDGVPVATGLVGGNLRDVAGNDDPNTIGVQDAWHDGNNYYYDYFFNGLIDEVRLYNRALSPAEVQDLYNWAPGPVAYYKFDEGSGATSVYDSSGNNNTGTLQSGFTQDDWTNGKFGNALEFDGTTSDWIDINAINGESSGLMGTYSTWVLRTFADTTATEKYLFFLRVDNGNSIAFRYLATGDFWYLDYTANNVESDINIGSASTIPQNTWTFLTITWDFYADEVKAYVNGVQMGSTVTGLGQFTGDFTTSRIGVTASTLAPWEGNMDEVKIYNYARTPAQIIEDMNAGHPAPGSPVGSAIGEWKFDEGYGDTANNTGSGGTGLNGNLAGSDTCPGDSNCPSWSNDGKYDKALNFDGGSDYVQIADNNSLDIANEITISVWVKPDTISGYDTILSSFRSGAGACSGKDIYFYTIAGNVGVVFDGPQTCDWNSEVAISAGVWTYLTVTYDGSEIKIYKNGILGDSTPASGTINLGTSTDAKYIGYNTAWGEYWDGLIDEVKIYSFALTVDQVKTEYNAGMAQVFGSLGTDASGNASYSSNNSYCPPGQTTACVVPVGEWKLDEKTGTTASDTSTNGNSLTGYNFVSNSSWLKGISGSAVDFESGNSQYFGILDANQTGLDITGPMTIESWIKLESYPSSGSPMPIASKWGVSGDYGYLLSAFNSAGTTYARLHISSDGTASSTQTGTTALSLNTWYHLAGVYDGTYLRIFLNGVEDNTPTSYSSGIFNNSIPFYVGRVTTLYADMAIDNVKLYNYARTPAQIAWDYNHGGPVGWWKLDENQTGDGQTVYDSSGNGYNGTTEGGTGNLDCTVAGKRNTACDFDGSDDYINTSTDNFFDISSDVTVSAWVNRSSFTTGDIVLAKDNDYTTGSDGGYVLVIGPNDNVKFHVSDTLGNVCPADSSFTSNLITSAGWHHLVGIFDINDGNPSRCWLYIDGKQVTPQVSAYMTTTSIPNALNLVIGAESDGGNPFDGIIDDVKIFNYALTPQQIQLEYNQGSVNFSQ